MGANPCKRMKKSLSSTSQKSHSFPSLEDVCYQMDVIDEVVFEEMGTLNPPLDLLEVCLLGTHDNRVELPQSDEREVYTHILDMAQPFPPQHHPKKILNVKVGPSKEDKSALPR